MNYTTYKYGSIIREGRGESMARIELTPEAARAVHEQLINSKQELGEDEVAQFEDRASQSRMMDEFEERVRLLKEYISQYEVLLDRDLCLLDDACKAIVAEDLIAAEYLSE